LSCLAHLQIVYLVQNGDGGEEERLRQEKGSIAREEDHAGGDIRCLEPASSASRRGERRERRGVKQRRGVKHSTNPRTLLATSSPQAIIASSTHTCVRLQAVWVWVYVHTRSFFVCLYAHFRELNGMQYILVSLCMSVWSAGMQYVSRKGVWYNECGRTRKLANGDGGGGGTHSTPTPVHMA
jgi:hypothetical protein